MKDLASVYRCVTLSETARLRTSSDGRDVGIALVRHEHDARLQAVDLVRLALGDHHERARDQRLARALVARHVEDRARLDVELLLKTFARVSTFPRVAAETPRLRKLAPRRRGGGARG